MFLNPYFYMVIIHSQVVKLLVSDIIKLYHLTIGLLPHPWSKLIIQWLILIFSHLCLSQYSLVLTVVTLVQWSSLISNCLISKIRLLASFFSARSKSIGIYV